MTLLLARKVSLLVERDDDKCASPKYSINQTWLQCHPSVGLMEETRPLLLDKHRCAPHLVQGVPELRWIFGVPELFGPT